MLKFSRIYILATTHQKAFIVGTKVPSRLSFHFMTSDPGSMPGGGARGQNLVHLKQIGFLRSSFLEVYILGTTYQKAFILGP